MTDQKDPKPSAAAEGTELPEQSISFHKLANGRPEITIEHEGQQYRLRATKNGKLLLNK